MAAAAGLLSYSLDPLPGGGHAAPEWVLGVLFGIGGLAVLYLGTGVQRFVPRRLLTTGLGLRVAGLGANYLWF